MTRGDLIDQAVEVGKLVLRNQHGKLTTFKELEHYFNSEGDEIGYVSFAHTEHEAVHLFSPPRKWGKEIKQEYSMTNLRGFPWEAV
jgi:hypothetical protein